MRWSKEAEEAISRVPFFVRKRVRKRVEEEAVRCEARQVTIGHVHACQKRFLTRMDEEVKGYRVETCFGSGGCPNRAVVCEGLAQQLEDLIAKRDLRAFLKEKVNGSLKFHHEFRVSISDCPNACSRPQISDVGLIGACTPTVAAPESCSRCEACVENCREGAMQMGDHGPSIDMGRCLACGQCITVCPTGTLQEGNCGYRVQVGGKLGRHPRLALELPGIHAVEDITTVLDRCLAFYQRHCTEGERFGEALERVGIDALLDDFKKS